MEKLTTKLAALFVATLILSSCGGIKKMQKQYGEVKYNVSPSPLEMHGGQVPVTINGKFPEKFFHKKAILELTPILKYDGGQTVLKSVTLQGEDAEANNKVIGYATGGSFDYTDTVEYKDAMFSSDLVITGVVSLGDNSVEFDSLKIARGVVATPDLVQNTPDAIMAADAFQRILPDTISADIHYLIQRSNLRRSELTNEDIKAFEEAMDEIAKDERKNFKKAAISAYASPDGPVDLNERVSGSRKGSADNYFKGQMRRKGIETKEETEYNTMTTTEDWEGFKSLVQNSDIEDKELILRVLSMYSDPVVREKELENMAATWEVLADDILPKLRRSELYINFEKVGYSDEELSELSTTNPDTLNLEELLYSTTLTEDIDQKQSILETAVEKYPESHRAINNLGCLYFEKGNVAEAKDAFKKSKELNDNDIVNNNLGAVALKNDNLAKAEELFIASMGAGDVVNYNLGIVNVIKGDYDAAVNYFGNVCKANAGLAKLLKKNHEEALKNLECIDNPSPEVAYMKAIIGARTDNDNMVYSNLRTAVGKSAELKKRAANDLEFVKYFKDETFQSIVQ
jgi:tetratricopeptide (TPR) repeat protein